MAKSMRGHTVNMAALIAASPTSVALGNGKMNARGDTITNRGDVVQSAEAKYSVYHTSTKAVKTRPVSIKDMGDDFFDSPAELVKKLTPATDETKAAPKKGGRKLVDE